MKDGIVKEEKNLLSPAFAGPVFDDDIETFVAEAEADLSSRAPSREQYLAMTASQL
jgi:predicted transcriptional regulator